VVRAWHANRIEPGLRSPRRMNGRPATLGGPHNDTVIITMEKEEQFKIVGQII